MKLIGYWILLLGCLGLMALGCSGPTCPDGKCPCCPDKKVEDLACRCGPKCNCAPKKGETCVPCPRKCNPTCPGCHKTFEAWAEVTLAGELHPGSGLLYIVDDETGDWVELDFSRSPTVCRKLTKWVVEQEWSRASVVGDWVTGQKRFIVSKLLYQYDEPT